MFRLEFYGLTSDSDDALMAVRAAFVEKLGYTPEEALAILTNTPYTIKTSENKSNLIEAFKILTAANANVEIIEEKEAEEDSFSFEFDNSPGVEEAKEQEKKVENVAEEENITADLDLSFTEETESEDIKYPKEEAKQIIEKQPSTQETQESEKLDEENYYYSSQVIHVDVSIPEKLDQKPFVTKVMDQLFGKVFGSDYFIPVLIGCLITLFVSIQIFDIKFFEEISTVEYDPKYAAKKNEDPNLGITEEEDVYLKYSGTNKDSEVQIKGKFTLLNSIIKNAIIDLATPPPPELTPEEIILNKQHRPWIEKISMERLQFANSPNSDSFIAAGRARMFIVQGEDKTRVVVPVAARSVYDAQEKKVKCAIIIKHGFDKIPEGKSYLLSNDSQGGYKILLKAYLEATEEGSSTKSVGMR